MDENARLPHDTNGTGCTLATKCERALCCGVRVGLGHGDVLLVVARVRGLFGVAARNDEKHAPAMGVRVARVSVG